MSRFLQLLKRQIFLNMTLLTAIKQQFYLSWWDLYAHMLTFLWSPIPINPGSCKVNSIHYFGTDYIAPYGMGHLSKTELNPTHFYTNPNFLLGIWKISPRWIRKNLNFLVKLCGKEIFGPWGPNKSLPDGTGICT